jgi:hypothetical protein
MYRDQAATTAGYTILMETLKGFPSLPALWLRRAKLGYANANASPHKPHFGSELVRTAG